MNLSLDLSLATLYKSHSQKARRITEDWVNRNMYCPHCGCEKIAHFPNNAKVADFYCPECRNEYELKSQRTKIASQIADGSYQSMIDRIMAVNNPDFFFLEYSLDDCIVNNLILVPKYFFVPDVIKKRNALGNNTRRHGWIGCSILLGKIPQQGRIPVIVNRNILPVENVILATHRSERLIKNNIKSRGWLMDILLCVNALKNDEFTLDDMYGYEEILKANHPGNNNIKPKIRQQLQFLRDKGIIEFVRRGLYRKVRN